MRFLTFEEARTAFAGKSVAIVGGGPTSLENRPGFVDSHEVVVRVNNYRTGEEQGWRCDVFYSYFGGAIRKRADELKRDGVRLCWAKCPDAKPISSAWHESRGKTAGIDFRYIYRQREGWWPCDVFVPSVEHFLRGFDLLERHVPTTGFAAILDVLDCDPARVFITGFDFFRSGQHNVDEKWKPGDPADPIGHLPELERDWLRANLPKYPVDLDRALVGLLK